MDNIKLEIENKLTVKTDGYKTTITIKEYILNKGYRGKSIAMNNSQIKDLISLLEIIK